MITIYRPSDRVAVKIGDVTIFISPLTPQKKAELIRLANELSPRLRSEDKTVQAAAINESTMATLRYAVKGIEAPGYAFPDGSPISLSTEPDGCLSEEGLSVLFAILDQTKLMLVASSYLKDGIKQWDIDGIEVKIPDAADEQKKSQ